MGICLLMGLILMTPGVLVWALVVLIQRESGAIAPAGEGVCARCGYPVRGLVSVHCPECGADLRAGGVRVGKSRQWWARLWLAGLTWCMAGLVMVPAVPEWVVRVCVPHEVTERSELTVTGPASQKYWGLMIEATGREEQWGEGNFGSAPPMEQIRVVTPAGAELVVDMRAGRFRWRGPMRDIVGAGNELREEDVRAWFKACGLDVEDRRVAREVVEVHRLTRAGVAGQLGMVSPDRRVFSFQSRSVRWRSEPVWGWAKPMLQASVGLGWIVGAVWFLRRVGRSEEGH